MKRIIAFLLLVLVSLTSTGAALVWDDPNPAGLVREFKVWREGPSGWELLATVATNRWEVVLPAGNNKVAVSAVSVDGLESDRSTNKFIAVVLIPSNLRIEQ